MEIVAELNTSEKLQIIRKLYLSLTAMDKRSDNQISSFLDEAFLVLAKKNGIVSNPAHFVSLSIKAMKSLQTEQKPSLIYKFSEMFTLNKAANPMQNLLFS